MGLHLAKNEIFPTFTSQHLTRSGRKTIPISHFTHVGLEPSLSFFLDLPLILPLLLYLRVDNNLVVKVGDFGLARDIYSSDYYRANQGAKIPVKWMAPETLHDAISNKKTDVVS